MHGPQQEGRAPDPVGQGRSIQGNASPGIDLGLSIEWKMVGELRDQHLGDGRLGGQPAFDQSGRRQRLHDHVGARPAGILRATHHQHSELRRQDVEALRDVLTEAVQCPGTARAYRARHIDHHLDARQVRRQSATIGPTPGGAGLALGRIVLLRSSLTRRRFLLGIFQRQLQLILRQALGPPPEAMSLELPDDLAQPLALDPLGDHHRLEQAGIVGKSVSGRGHNASESQPPATCERFDTVGCDQLAAVGTAVCRGS